MRSRSALRTRLAALALALALAPAAPALAAEPEGAREPETTAQLVVRALSLLGVNYRFGGNSPDSGLDCSGLVRHVFEEAAGLMLPRRSEEMSRQGQKVALDQLRPGDLVFFNTLRRAFSHVGIYVGNGKFVHAPSKGGVVRVESIDSQYWSKRFNGARRVLAGGPYAQPADPLAPLIGSLTSPSRNGGASTGSAVESLLPHLPLPHLN